MNNAIVPGFVITNSTPPLLPTNGKKKTVREMKKEARKTNNNKNAKIDAKYNVPCVWYGY